MSGGAAYNDSPINALAYGAVQFTGGGTLNLTQGFNALLSIAAVSVNGSVQATQFDFVPKRAFVVTSQQPNTSAIQTSVALSGNMTALSGDVLQGSGPNNLSLIVRIRPTLTQQQAAHTALLIWDDVRLNANMVQTSNILVGLGDLENGIFPYSTPGRLQVKTRTSNLTERLVAGKIS